MLGYIIVITWVRYSARFWYYRVVFFSFVSNKYLGGDTLRQGTYSVSLQIFAHWFSIHWWICSFSSCFVINTLVFQWCDFLMSLFFFTLELFCKEELSILPHLLIQSFTCICVGSWVIWIIMQCCNNFNWCCSDWSTSGYWLIFHLAPVPFGMSPSVPEHCFTFGHHRVF